MSATWVTIVPEDVTKVISSVITTTVNDQDSGGTGRVESVIGLVVAQVREQIRSSGRVALSLDATRVPPGAVVHVLTLVVRRLVDSYPGLAAYCGTDLFKRDLENAEKWLEQAGKGLNVPSSDAPDPDNALPNAVEFGDIAGIEAAGVGGHLDLTTDGV